MIKHSNRIWHLLAVILIVGAMAMPLIPAKPAQAWWNASWLYRKVLSFNGTSLSAATINGTVLVTLNASNFDFTKAQTHGEDVRFVDADDATQLPYEIVSWNATAQTAQIYVLVPQVNNTYLTDFMYVYYGNALATNAETPNSLWSYVGAVGVWHLNSDNNTGATIYDSTNTGANGTSNNATRTSSGYFIGGEGGYLDMTNNAAFNFTSGNFSIVMWANHSLNSNPAVEAYLVSRGLSSQRGYNFYTSSTRLRGASNQAGAAQLVFSNTGFVSSGIWQDYQLVRNNATMSLYVDGAEVTYAAQPAITDPVTSADSLYLGDYRGIASTSINGTMSEARIYNRILSADELKIDHLNRVDGLLYYGSTNLYPDMTTNAATGVTMNKDGVTGGTFSGNATAMGGSPTANVWFNYGTTTAYGTVTANQSAIAVGQFTAAIPAGLTPGTTYHYRAEGSTNLTVTKGVGADQLVAFTMPTVSTTTNTITQTTATLRGNVTNMGVASSAYVRVSYGTTPALGSTTALQTVAGTGTFSADITPPTTSTTLYYRADVIVGAVTVSGAIVTASIPAATGGSLLSTILTVVLGGVIAVGVLLVFLYAGMVPGLVATVIGITAFAIVSALLSTI